MAENANLQPAQTIAKIFGVSTRRIEQLKAEGIIKGEGKPTKYDLFPTIQEYIRYLSDKANGREKKQTTAELEEAKLRAEVDIKEAKAAAAKIELAELRGKMHRADDVEAITTDHVLFLRSVLMAMPGRLAVDCVSAKSAQEASEIIRREVYSILDNLTNYKYDADEYKKRVRGRRGMNEEQSHEDNECDNE